MTDNANPLREVILAVPKQKLSAEEYEQRRAERVEFCLAWLLATAKAQIDPGAWGPFGLLETQSYLEALATGTTHPFIKVYKKRAKARRHSHPPRTMNERMAQRYMVLGCITLSDRAGLDKAAARERMAKAADNVFPEAPTADALKHWELQLEPVVSPLDEALIARAISRSGITNLNALADFFINLARTVLHPSATLIEARA